MTFDTSFPFSYTRLSLFLDIDLFVFQNFIVRSVWILHPFSVNMASGATPKTLGEEYSFELPNKKDMGVLLKEKCRPMPISKLLKFAKKRRRFDGLPAKWTSDIQSEFLKWKALSFIQRCLKTMCELHIDIQNWMKTRLYLQQPPMQIIFPNCNSHRRRKSRDADIS